MNRADKPDKTETTKKIGTKTGRAGIPEAADPKIEKTDKADYAKQQNPSALPEEDALLRWYDASRRDLPWRRDKDPYHVWVSEIMLQQTRVEAVKDYYRRFMERLPDVRALADAEEDEYMKLWEGLGYYSRIRNMHKAAVTVVSDYGGRMPRTRRELLQLPGIGDYTASAIASIAFGERTPAVDGNLLRIFSRMTHYAEDIKKPAAKKTAESWYLGIMSFRDPGSFNQALMDLGATVCVPKGDPACLTDPAACPWSAACACLRDRDPQDYPRTAPKKSRRIEHRTVFLIRYGGQIAIRRRPKDGLLAGLFEFPNTLGTLDREEALRYVESLGFVPLKISELPPAKHVFSHIEWRMTGYQVLADEWTPLGGAFSEAAGGTDAAGIGAGSAGVGNVEGTDAAGPAAGVREAAGAGGSGGAGLVRDGARLSGYKNASEPSGVGRGSDAWDGQVFGRPNGPDGVQDETDGLLAGPDGSGAAAAGVIVLADAEEVRDHYPIPSAFQAFRKRIVIE